MAETSSPLAPLAAARAAIPRLTREDVERMSEPEPNTGCWLWTGRTRGKEGYAVVPIRHHLDVQVTRILLGIVDAPEVHARHRCDTPGCVNPDHLLPGSRSDNQRDSVVCRRHVNARRTHCIHGHALSGDNLRVDRAGKRVCRACRSRSARRARKEGV